MTGGALVLLAATGVVATADWAAVLKSARRVEYAAKPAVMIGLIAVALAVHPVSSAERAFFVIALALGLASDVFLMLPRDMFVAGLVAALVEHLAYIAGFPRCSWSWSPAREVAGLSSRWRERCCSSIRTQSWRGIGSSSRSRWVASSTSFPTMRGKLCSSSHS